jgi:alkylation response protein AidB-like acyl-CoA dehydrogenase
MDFALSPETDAIRQRIRAFVEERLIPLERDPASYDEHENIARPLLERMRAEARKQGLWALGMPKGRGGGGLTMAELAPCYEEMNRSIFGPSCSTARRRTTATCACWSRSRARTRRRAGSSPSSTARCSPPSP